VPTGLVSLVTLTQRGDFDEGNSPVDRAGVEAADLAAVASVVPPAVEVAAAQLGPVPGLGTVLRRLAARWASPSTSPLDLATVAGPDPDAEAAPAEQVAAATSPAPAAGQGQSPGAGGGGMPAADVDPGDVESLATAQGPWVFLVALVGTVTLFARQRRLARQSAAHRLAGAAPATRGLFRFWTPHAALLRPTGCRPGAVRVRNRPGCQLAPGRGI
jgi:hypothetical protein